MTDTAKNILKELSNEDKETLKQRFGSFDDIKKLYEENSEFKRFVDRNCAMYGYQKEFAFLCKTVQDVAEYYAHKYDDVVEHDICPCGLEQEDKAC